MPSRYTSKLSASRVSYQIVSWLFFVPHRAEDAAGLVEEGSAHFFFGILDDAGGQNLPYELPVVLLLSGGGS